MTTTRIEDPEAIRRSAARRAQMAETCRLVGRANRTHGGTGTPLHEVWLGMMKRCHNPKLRFA